MIDPFFLKFVNFPNQVFFSKRKGVEWKTVHPLSARFLGKMDTRKSVSFANTPLHKHQACVVNEPSLFITYNLLNAGLFVVAQTGVDRTVE